MAHHENELQPAVESPVTGADKKAHRKAETARVNGAKSKGPITPEGKNKSSQNAIRHGLTANKHTLLSAEFEDEYQEVLDAFIADLQPATKAELRIVQKIANIDWRLERLVFFETSLLNLETTVHAETVADRFNRIDGVGFFIESWKEDSSTIQRLDLLRRYLTTLQHQLNSMLNIFYKLQKNRLARTHGGTDLAKEWGPPYEVPSFSTHVPATTTAPVECARRAGKPQLPNEPTPVNGINSVTKPPLRPAA